MKEGLDPSFEIEEEETEASIPIWRQLFDVEAAVLLEDSE
jgi:hypothetical protein